SRRSDLLDKTGVSSTDALWTSILERPYPFVRAPAELNQLAARWPDEEPRVLAAAQRALAHKVDVLGTGLVELGDPIEWHRDWKTGCTWPLRYGRRMRSEERRVGKEGRAGWSPADE